jgi:DNA polymerase-1
VVIIGEAPGEAEARTGKPFQGKSGQLLRGELATAGLTSTYITNVVKCRPPQNRAPTPTEIKACREYLDDEFATIKPKAILALGAVASKAVLKKAKITSIHGQILEKDGVVTSAIYHPAYCLRDPSKLPAFQQDLRRFSAHLRGEKRTSTVNWAIVQRENLSKFISDLRICTEFAFDTETSGLNWFDPENRFFRCVQIAIQYPGGADFGWVIPMSMEGSPFPTGRLQTQIMDIVFDELEGKPACAQNGKFDNLWLWAIFRRKFHLTFDTMLASHTLNENQDHDLKSLVRGILDEPDYDIDLAIKRGEVVSPMRLYKYGAFDAVYTLRLKHKFMAQFRRDVTLRKLFFKLVMPAARSFQDIDSNGLYVNLERMAETELDVAKQLKQTLAELNSMTPRQINWNSSQQVASLLYGDLKLPVVVKTDKGAPSTGEEALLAIKGKHPIAEKLVKYRELEKFRSTYLDGWKEFMVGPMLYLSTKLHGTVTGRYSSRLHQVPRDGTIRSLVEAPEGWTFVQGDLSQAELRVAAILSHDAELVTCYRRGVDVHWRTLLHLIGKGSAASYVDPAWKTATALNGRRRPSSLTIALELLMKAGPDRCTEVWKGWKEARKTAKATNFGFLFGMMEAKFIETCKLKYGFEPTMKEAKSMREGFFQLYRQLPDWHKKQKRLVHLNGYVRNLAGRMRRLPGVHSPDWSLASECERQAINSPVQGYIGDHKAMAAIEIHETFDWERELRIVGEVHDALLLWIRTDRLQKILPRVAAIMREPKLVREFGIKLTVPLEADLTIGPWGAGKTWRETHA